MDKTEVAVNDAQNSPENIQTQLQEEYLKSLETLEEGQLVDGIVIQITPDQVFIDVGYKSEGKIPISEFSELPKIGDTVSVVLIAKENKHGEVIVSKQKADAKQLWKNLRQAFQDKTPVDGVIEKAVKGGFEVNLGSDMRAFLPISQSDMQRVEKPEKLLGTKSKFYIERLYSDNKANVVVNRRRYMEENMEKKREAFFNDVSIGDTVTGTVKSFTSFGAFIDLGGFDGLLHINDMSWGHVTRPKDFVKKGQEITLKVVRLDPAEKRINLSLKHFSEDPWLHFEDKYHVNDIVKGHVTKLADFGAFIELEEGIEGLVHISEFSWVRKINKPSDVVKVGDEVECMVLGYDIQAGRVSLGLKQVTANPWDNIADKYPVGTRLTRKVVKLTNAGAFVELEEGIDGFLPAEDLSWKKKVKHPGSELSVDQEIEVIVTENDPENRRIRLSVKHLTEDPWQPFAASYPAGSVLEGEIVSITDFGLFVRVDGDIEGLVNKSNLSEDKDEPYEEAVKKYNVGDKINVYVVEINPEKQKAAFSVKEFKKKMQRAEISQYMSASDNDEDGAFTLGDLLKNKQS
ncbi:ribosomal protein S1 [Treponema lecithinolyticum ATCC 700332]|uniref:30S ribosomal protein S1 n=1 Tax=Treponema lecithinolyticum ATCC 700332 TaxID=1321815 RepID=A0ABN0NXW9_TRELE|nr:ribosomal protein S1 [Treponema lecithinolyticum ATCC 700332]